MNPLSYADQSKIYLGAQIVAQELHLNRQEQFHLYQWTLIRTQARKDNLVGELHTHLTEGSFENVIEKIRILQQKFTLSQFESDAFCVIKQIAERYLKVLNSANYAFLMKDYETVCVLSNHILEKWPNHPEVRTLFYSINLEMANQYFTQFKRLKDEIDQRDEDLSQSEEDFFKRASVPDISKEIQSQIEQEFEGL